MAALLEGDLDKFDRVILDLKECKEWGLMFFLQILIKVDIIL